MSQGAFINAKYEKNNGSVAVIRVQPETITEDNPVAGGTVTADRVRVSGSARRIGTKARQISVKFEGTAPAGYKPGSILRVPVFQKSIFDAMSEGQAFEYQGQSATIVGVFSESGRR
jgi:hypothetical protein